jgi:hypothetical protein
MSLERTDRKIVDVPVARLRPHPRQAETNAERPTGRPAAPPGPGASPRGRPAAATWSSVAWSALVVMALS